MEPDESLLEQFDDTSLIRQIIKIQAVIRGCVIRKHMKDIRHLYEEIVNDIDGPEMGVVWSHDHISRPHVRKVKKPKSKLGDHNLITESSTCQDSEPGSAVKTFKAMTSHAETKVPGHHGPSVAETEIQTDGFLDVDEQNWPAQDINPNCSLRQFQEHVNFKDKLVKIQPSIVSSEVQTDEADLPSFQPHKTCAAVQVSPDISDHVVLNKPSQADDVPYDVEQHSRGGRSGLEAGASEEDVSLPGKLEHHMAENCEDLGESETRSLSGETDAADHEHQGGRNTVTRAADLKQDGGESWDLPDSKEQLLQLKKLMAMELLWVQQAINSRKHYLRLKEQLE